MLSDDNLVILQCYQMTDSCHVVMLSFHVLFSHVLACLLHLPSLSCVFFIARYIYRRRGGLATNRFGYEVGVDSFLIMVGIRGT